MRRGLLGSAQFIVRSDPDPVLRQFGQDVLPVIAVLFFHQFADPFIQTFQQFAGGVGAVVAHQIFLIGFFAHDRRHPHHKKFVQIAAENGKELQPLQQRIAAVGRFIQYPAVEFQPADVTVDKIFVVHAVSCSVFFCFCTIYSFLKGKASPFLLFSVAKNAFSGYIKQERTKINKIQRLFR